MLWSDRQIAGHVALGLAEGPVVLEVRANLLAQLGDAAGAVRLYAAGEAHHRRVGLPWPQQPWTAELRRRAAAQLTPADAEAATSAGASLTLLDLPPVTGSASPGAGDARTAGRQPIAGNRVGIRERTHEADVTVRADQNHIAGPNAVAPGDPAVRVDDNVLTRSPATRISGRPASAAA